ncbi:MAG: type II toxin-antitoxin system HicB family antitoxin [Chloroflexota bacterium]|nr:type II toxin-antitoxin system HicB family antitoxin [Chloroflexota bacterium]
MGIYQLEYILHEPEESEGWMYLAEIPALQGCMAWGETPEETLKSLLAVAQTIIQLRQEEGQALPPEITPLRSPEGTLTVTA